MALTLDIDLQEDVEKALSKTIGDMTEEDGIRRGGAAVVVGVGSGEVLALAHKVQEAVRAKFGVEIAAEVNVL